MDETEEDSLGQVTLRQHLISDPPNSWVSPPRCWGGEEGDSPSSVACTAHLQGCPRAARCGAQPGAGQGRQRVESQDLRLGAPLGKTAQEATKRRPSILNEPRWDLGRDGTWSRRGTDGLRGMWTTGLPRAPGGWSPRTSALFSEAPTTTWDFENL